MAQYATQESFERHDVHGLHRIRRLTQSIVQCIAQHSVGWIRYRIRQPRPWLEKPCETVSSSPFKTLRRDASLSRCFTSLRIISSCAGSRRRIALYRLSLAGSSATHRRSSRNRGARAFSWVNVLNRTRGRGCAPPLAELFVPIDYFTSRADQSVPRAGVEPLEATPPRAAVWPQIGPAVAGVRRALRCRA